MATRLALMPEGTNAPLLQDLLRKTASDGAAWIEAEAALAREATSSAAGLCFAGMALAFGAAAMFLVALVVISQAAIFGLAPHVGGILNAAIAVAVVLVLLAAVLALASWGSMRSTRRRFEFVSRWLP